MEILEITLEEETFLKEKVESLRINKAVSTKSTNAEWDNNWADWDNYGGHNNWENSAPEPPGGK